MELSKICSSCKQEHPRLIYEGPELEPICIPCLERLDPARAAILKKLPPLAGNP